jgi:cellulose synthase/poly-beta-1,6-N-acetylglucosamine synthase-like glycosyltransferase
MVLTVHNEEGLIRQRVENLLSLDYPRDRLEILVASDGSNDLTNEIVEEFERSSRVRLLRFDRLGKSEAQNRAVYEAKGDIIAFTDAPCLFDPDYLDHLVGPFADPTVGCVTANLRFSTASGSIAQSQGYYWAYELRLREEESHLGILVVASGAAMAVRRGCFCQLDPGIGEDCSLPLDVAANGHRVVHATDANARDTMESDSASEFRARVRMTMRNWSGTWKRPELLNPFVHAGYAFSLWSHKLLRWLSPLFLALMVVSSIPLAFDPLFWPVPVIVAILFSTGALGYLAERRGLAIPVAGTVWSFLLANAGFSIGVLSALAGHRVISYRGRDTD